MSCQNRHLQFTISSIRFGADKFKSLQYYYYFIFVYKILVYYTYMISCMDTNTFNIWIQIFKNNFCYYYKLYTYYYYIKIFHIIVPIDYIYHTKKKTPENLRRVRGTNDMVRSTLKLTVEHLVQIMYYLKPTIKLESHHILAIVYTFCYANFYIK